ncbi:expressed unknown protein [Seminavis robusta]|uniref:Uncharacterized protein n=1 Tax=Seminavis robusta TaxID=568900 RepID=A0A9N8DEC0_9STRA|nr:expressed unknown protein [Seminavis robusta]|eukprot:Sro49_g028690.1 n/a (290) ;mRNA; r:82988-84388
MITVLKSCIMAEGDTNPMGDDALAEMQIDEVRAPPGPDNCGPFWRWEISEEQLVECVKDKIPLVLRSYVDPKKKGKIQLHTILDPQDQVYCLDCVAHAIGLPEDQIPLNPQSLKLHKAGTSLYQHCMGKTAAQQEAEEQRKILAEKERAAEEAARLAESSRPFQPVEAETMTVESLCKQFHWDLNDPAKVQQATAMIDAIQGSDEKQTAKEPQPQSDDDQSDSEQSDNPGETMTAKQKSKKNASSQMMTMTRKPQMSSVQLSGMGGHAVFLICRSLLCGLCHQRKVDTT